MLSVRSLERNEGDVSDPIKFIYCLPEGDTAELPHGRRGTASSPEDGVRVNPLRRLYAGLRRKRLAEVPSPLFFTTLAIARGAECSGPLSGKSGPAPLSSCTALRLSRAPALLRCS